MKLPPIPAGKALRNAALIGIPAQLKGKRPDREFSQAPDWGFLTKESPGGL
jgi:hypothetical protein